VSDPATVEIAGLGEDKFVVDIAFKAAGVKRQAPLDGGETRVGRFIGPGGILAYLPAGTDGPVTRAAFPFTQRCLVAGGKKFPMDVGGRNVPGWRVAGLKNSVGRMGLGDQLTVMKDSYGFRGWFETRRPWVVPDGFLSWAWFFFVHACLMLRV
jgi:hypothetical protein